MHRCNCWTTIWVLLCWPVQISALTQKFACLQGDAERCLTTLQQLNSTAAAQLHELRGALQQAELVAEQGASMAPQQEAEIAALLKKKTRYNLHLQQLDEQLVGAGFTDKVRFAKDAFTGRHPTAVGTDKKLHLLCVQLRHTVLVKQQEDYDAVMQRLQEVTRRVAQYHALPPDFHAAKVLYNDKLEQLKAANRQLTECLEDF
jgi:hypothetical protein